MPKLIRNGAVEDDRWQILPDAYSLTDLPDGVPVIVPLVLWLAERRALRLRGDVGVLIAPDEDPAQIADDVPVLKLIAIDFPSFNDGRGYSTARLLRERYRYEGELRAVGDVLRDQLYLMSECGFDAFALREDRDANDALAGFKDFTGVYASTTRTPQPWFRRRAAAASADAWYPDL
jgi:uncharacterized protein (DUF934 family)